MTEQPSVLPEMVRLSVLARELNVSNSHDLVRASSRNEFVPLVRVGRRWFARRADVDAWFQANHTELVCLCSGTPGGRCPLHKPGVSHG